MLAFLVPLVVIAGANHHLGDDSFVAAYGRAPTAADSEKLRMRVHLQYVRDELAKKPATREALAGKRSELLGFLDDYIAKGITPQNTRLPWRTPVFIDDFGNVCAVGYLIERSAGRALPETIAKTHRFDYLEDIAAAMPEVRAWVEASGFTLDELASIQPGYSEPNVESWHRWDLAKTEHDGIYAHTPASSSITASGVFEHRNMEGSWKVTMDEHVLGKGTLHRGAGTWQSFDHEGHKLAEGPFAKNDPHGTWTMFHPSGHVAAVGRFDHGLRDGQWTFFYDTAESIPLAKGRFKHGSMAASTWRHFDAKGQLLATSRYAMQPHGDDFGWPFLTVLQPGPDGVRHEIHTTGGVDNDRLDLFAFDGERVYVMHDTEAGPTLMDADGNELRRVGTGWRSGRCDWSAKRKAIARSGDITTLHGMIDRDTTVCAQPTTKITGARKKRLDAIDKAMSAIREPTPTFVKRLALGVDKLEGFELGEGQDHADLGELIAAGMGWYVEWPHIDGRFIQLFHTLPGYSFGEDFGFADEPSHETD